MRKYLALSAALLPIMFAASCRDTGSDSPVTSERSDSENIKYYVNMFAYNMMNTYYLWSEEITSKLNEWKTTDDPIEKVEEVRYKDSSGNDIDRWTQLTDDYEEFTSSVAGTSSTYGFNFTLYYLDSAKTTVCCVVTVVYKGSPAEKAGLKRGDCIIKVGNKQLGIDDYADILTNDFYGQTSCELTLYDGKSVSLTQVEMYEDPVLLYKTFENGEKKIGYLAYNSFTQASYEKLIEACRYFKAENVKELVLDLRYNGGGYTLVELALASMIAPEQNVLNGDVFEREVFNKTLTEAWGDDAVTKFTTDFTMTDGKESISYSTSGANIGLDKVYAIVSSSTASASESLIGNLKPYMDIAIVGNRTHGKYCSGIIYSANKWYNSVKDQISTNDYSNGIKYADNWGIYVMIGRYADKNGKTLCMPDGISPDQEVYDSPVEGLQLGDPEETMLKAALQLAGYSEESKSIRTAGFTSSSVLTPLPDSAQPRSAGFGMKICCPAAMDGAPARTCRRP